MGEIFQGWVTVNSAQEALKVVAKAATHATVQGTIGTIDGGDFGSSFLTGFAGSMVGSAGDALKWGSVGTVSSAMLMGGVSSELSGGEFWRGAAIGGIVAGANHVAHRVGASAEAKVREKRQQKRTEQNGTDPIWSYGSPVAWSIGLDLDVIIGVGGDMNPVSYGTVLKGKDKGTGFILSDGGIGVGLDVSAAVEGVLYFYTGDISNFTVNSLNGPRVQMNFGISFFADLGLGVTVSKPDKFGG